VNQEQIDQIKRELQPLAEKLGEGAAFVYETYVRQQMISGVVSLVGSLVGSVVVFLALKWFWRLTMVKQAEAVGNSYYASTYDGEGWVWARVTATVLACIWFLVSFFVFFDGVQHLLNPHYYAIQDLLSSIRGGE
jgi:hypothetical protein